MKDVYRRILKDARIKAEAEGKELGYRHLDGWRACKRNTIVDLYIRGKCSVVQAIAAGARPIDHLEAVSNGHVSLDDLIDAGIDIHKLETVRKQVLGRLGHKVMSEKDATTIEQARAVREAQLKAKNMPKTMCVVKKGDKTMAIKMLNKPLTKQQIEVAEAMVRHAQMEKLRKQLAAAKAERAKLNLVSALTPEEIAEIAARNENKGKLIIK